MKTLILNLSLLATVLLTISCGNNLTNIEDEIQTASFGSTPEVTATPKSSIWTDKRDNKVYKTVVIDGKEWLAEELNFESVNSKCYMDNCESFGRCYPFVDLENAIPTAEGWRLPNFSDVKSLLGIRKDYTGDEIQNHTQIYLEYCCKWNLFSPSGLSESAKSREDINATGFSARANLRSYNSTINGDLKWQKSSGLAMWTQEIIDGKRVLIYRFNEGLPPLKELKVIRVGFHLDDIKEEKRMYSIRIVRDL